MCLIIHRPAGRSLPAGLLESAAAYNPHGFGIVHFDPAGSLRIVRRKHTRTAELERLYAATGDTDCVLHFRYRTHGAIDLENTHPLRVTSRIHLLHNGTVRLSQHEPSRSDTWHLVRDYLRPILSRRPQLLHEASFSELLLAWAGPHNRFVFIDAQTRATVIVNRDAGLELDGCWLSNARWFDAPRFVALDAPPRALARRLAFAS